MTIHHLAIWVNDLELMKTFYTRFFNCEAGKKYHNPQKSFSSYFIIFESGAKIELMHRTDIDKSISGEHLGYTHFAISAGSEENVDKLTQLIEEEGYKIHNYPRTTGDGYYESVVLDPEGNRVEITI